MWNGDPNNNNYQVPPYFQGQVPARQPSYDYDGGLRYERDPPMMDHPHHLDPHGHAPPLQSLGQPPRGKPEAAAAQLASAARIQEKMDQLESEGGVVPGMDVVAEPAKPAPKKQTSPKKRKRNPSKSAGPQKTAKPSVSMPTPLILSMDDPVPQITPAEYENLDALMTQFCKVPLLAEFSRPVALLHPELMGTYSKIIGRPIDLGKVCRSIRKREYKDLRAVRLDMWRIFSNCVKYHTHPSNKDAMPSFVSIALHLRDFFNALWQEYMISSEPPLRTTKKNAYEARVQHDCDVRMEMRKKRLIVSGVSMIAGKSAERAANSLHQFIQSGGCVDRLDSVPIFEDSVAADEDGDLQTVKQNLNKLVSKLREVVASDEDYGIDELDKDLRQSYTKDIFENKPALRIRIGHRIDRFIAKIIVPIYEASCRGVSQSSIWGCIATAVWARESSKKPFWPALVLGIMAPEDQREEWHAALTERNEARLPQKLRSQLTSGKKKAETALKRQAQGHLDPQSYFLVEFLGTHEFIWVKESDLVENFDPNEDPNEDAALGSKKKRSSRSNAANVVGSETYITAMEEAKWALEEFEVQLQDAGGDMPEEDEEDAGEMNYNFSVLCQSDDEADGERIADQSEKPMKAEDIDECNELLATDGLLDYSVEGRKNAKKRVQTIKKVKADSEKEKKKKADKAKKAKTKDNQVKKQTLAKERESKKEMATLQRRRKKRSREREKALKTSKKLKSPSDEHRKPGPPRRNIIYEKRERATAIVDGYLFEAAEKGDYASFGPPGINNIPAAIVESSGILGMALAFRAAAGELPMGDESGCNDSPWDPWETINIDDKSSEDERNKALLQQISLLQHEVKRLQTTTKKRKDLTFKAIEENSLLGNDKFATAKAARENPLKKKPQQQQKKDGPPLKKEAPEIGNRPAKEHLSENASTDVANKSTVLEMGGSDF